MYSPLVTAQQISLAEQVLKTRLVKHSIAEVQFYNDHFKSLTEFNDKGTAIGWRKDVRPNGLRPDELAYILNETVMCKLDFLYFGSRYVFIKDLNKEIVRWAPNIAQLVLVSIWGSAEEKAWAILLLELKARQLGITTANMIAIAHRVLFWRGTDAIMASSDPSKSRDMADKVELICDNMPWWLLPARSASQTGGLLEYKQLQSKLNIFWGNQKQGLARGSTPGVFHLSEIPDFEDAKEKIEDSLLNAIHENPMTFGVMESSGKGKGNYWHEKWVKTKELYPQGKSRIRPLFLPVYVGEKDLYPTKTWLSMHPIPHNWQPLEITERYRENGEEYVANDPDLREHMGVNWKMSREHMWRWEFQRNEAIENENLSGFLQEWAASDTDSFQAPFSNVFGGELIYEIQSQQKMPKAVYAIEGPADEISPYTHSWLQNEVDTSKEPIIIRPRWTDSIPTTEYRFIPLQFHSYPSTFSPIGKLLIFEWPEDGEEYGLGVDPSYGKGKDGSALEGIRNRTMDRCEAQVLEFVSPLLDSHLLWPYVLPIADFLSVFRNGTKTQCRLAIEMAANGQEVQRELKDRGWWNFHQRVPDDAKTIDYSREYRFGFETTRKSRPKVTQGLERAIRDKTCTVNSPWLLEECGGLIWNADKQRLEAGYGSTDDRFMALGMIRESFRQTETPSMRVYAHQQKLEREQKEKHHPVFRPPDQARDIPSDWYLDHEHEFSGSRD